MMKVEKRSAAKIGRSGTVGTEVVNGIRGKLRGGFSLMGVKLVRGGAEICDKVVLYPVRLGWSVGCLSGASFGKS